MRARSQGVRQGRSRRAGPTLAPRSKDTTPNTRPRRPGTPGRAPPRETPGAPSRRSRRRRTKRRPRPPRARHRRPAKTAVLPFGNKTAHSPAKTNPNRAVKTARPPYPPATARPSSAASTPAARPLPPKRCAKTAALPFGRAMAHSPAKTNPNRAVKTAPRLHSQKISRHCSAPLSQAPNKPAERPAPVRALTTKGPAGHGWPALRSSPLRERATSDRGSPTPG